MKFHQSEDVQNTEHFSVKLNWNGIYFHPSIVFCSFSNENVYSFHYVQNFKACANCNLKMSNSAAQHARKWEKSFYTAGLAGNRAAKCYNTQQQWAKKLLTFDPHLSNFLPFNFYRCRSRLNLINFSVPAIMTSTLRALPFRSIQFQAWFELNPRNSCSLLILVYPVVEHQGE